MKICICFALLIAYASAGYIHGGLGGYGGGVLIGGGGLGHGGLIGGGGLGHGGIIAHRTNVGVVSVPVVTTSVTRQAGHGSLISGGHGGIVGGHGGIIGGHGGLIGGHGGLIGGHGGWGK